MDLEKVIKKRHSVRNFKQTKKVNWRDVVKAIDAANYAPQAGNISVLRFILVSDKEKINKLAECCAQEFISQAKYLVIVCSKLDQIERAYDERGLRYAKQQAGASIQNFLLEITNLGLASCWIGAFDDRGVKDCLDIPDDVDVEALLPIGYEMGNGKPRKKPNLDSVLWFDKWKNKFMKPKPMIDTS